MAEDKRTVLAGWVKAHTNDLLRYARGRVNDDATAEDLVQTTFISAWETMDRFAGQSSPRTWLFAILKHKLADHYRKVYREGRHLSGKEVATDDLTETLFAPDGHWLAAHRPQDDPAIFNDETDNERMDRALRHCLEALPPHLRSAVEMKYLLEKDSAEIRAALGISEANYWQQVHRAKLKLRACIEGRVMRTA